jgi:hypothetical protein
MNLTLQRTHTIGPRTFGKLFADEPGIGWWKAKKEAR